MPCSRNLEALSKTWTVRQGLGTQTVRNRNI